MKRKKMIKRYQKAIRKIHVRLHEAACTFNEEARKRNIDGDEVGFNAAYGKASAYAGARSIINTEWSKAVLGRVE